MDGNASFAEALRGVIPETRRLIDESRKNSPPRQTKRIDWAGRQDRFNIKRGIVALGVSAGLVLGGPVAMHAVENSLSNSLGNNQSSNILIAEAGMPSQNLPIAADAPNPPATSIESSNPNVLISEVKGITSEKIDVNKLTAKLMPEVPTGLKKNAEASVPKILDALHDEGIDSPKVIAFALANSEPESNLKIDEEEIDAEGQASKYSYDGGKDYAAKGLSALTHKYNYIKYGKRLGIDLEHNPSLAKDERYSAKIYAAFLKDEGIADAVEHDDLKRAREIFGGTITPDDAYRNQILHYIIQRTNDYYRRLKN